MLLKIRQSKNDRAGKGAEVDIANTSSDGIKLQDRIAAYSKLRLSQGAKPEDSFLVQ